jgi:arsenate reductase
LEGLADRSPGVVRGQARHAPVAAPWPITSWSEALCERCLASGAMELWHNPRCSKSRAAKALLDERGFSYAERRYLEDRPTAAELEAVLRALGREPWEIARFGEPVARELGLRELPHDRARWIELLAANPILIERPILVTGDGRAALGRPPEAIEAVL